MSRSDWILTVRFAVMFFSALQVTIPTKTSDPSAVRHGEQPVGMLKVMTFDTIILR